MTTATRAPIRIGEVTVLTPGTLGGIRINKVREREPHVNMLVYGKSGVGKTWLAGSSFNVPEMNRVLFLDVEGGTLTLRKDFPEIEVVRLESWRDVQKIYDGLKAGGHGFKTIIIDSLTEVQKFNMRQIMEDLVARKPERDEDVPDMREWGKNLEQIRRFVRGYRDLPMNVIFTCLEREDKDRDGRPIRLPDLSGKMAQQVAAFMDIVCYYRVAEVKKEEGSEEKITVRLLQSIATQSTTAKDRSGRLPKVMRNPTMPILYDYIIRQTGGRPKEDAKDVDAVLDNEMAPGFEEGVTREEAAPAAAKPFVRTVPTDEEVAALTANN